MRIFPFRICCSKVLYYCFKSIPIKLNDIPYDLKPDMWAALKGLGKRGVSDPVWELHQKAVYFSEMLKEAGFEILNDVVFNQVLARYK